MSFVKVIKKHDYINELRYQFTHAVILFHYCMNSLPAKLAYLLLWRETNPKPHYSSQNYQLYFIT